MYVYLAHLHSALILFNDSWSSSLRTEQKQLRLLQVVIFTGTWKYNWKEEPYRISQCYLFSVWQWPCSHLSREGENVWCWGPCAGLPVLKWFFLGWFWFLWSYLSTCRAHEQRKTMLMDVVSWVSMFIFDLVYCSLQRGILKVMECLAHATV